MQKGKASIAFDHPPYITAASSVAGKKEGEGPLGALFDLVEQEDMLGEKNWEAAESRLQKEAAELAIQKEGGGNPLSFCRGSVSPADCHLFWEH